MMPAQKKAFILSLWHKTRKTGRFVHGEVYKKTVYCQVCFGECMA
jgi:hypothetical protein